VPPTNTATAVTARDHRMILFLIFRFILLYLAL
jgi:hypothetical protein